MLHQQHRQHFSQRQALAFFLRLYIRTHFKLVKKDSFLALDNDKMPALLLLSCKDHSMWKFDFFFLLNKVIHILNIHLLLQGGGSGGWQEGSAEA